MGWLEARPILSMFPRSVLRMPQTRASGKSEAGNTSVVVDTASYPVRDDNSPQKILDIDAPSLGFVHENPEYLVVH